MPLFCKKNVFVCKNSHTHLHYIHNKYAWFQNDPLKTVRGVDYTNFIPDNAKKSPKMTKFESTEYSHTIVAWWLSGIRRGYFYGYCEGLVSK